MKKMFLFALFLITSLANANTPKNIISFDAMYGVDGPFVDNSSIRHVKGDELPWSIKSAHGSLTTGGHLHITVKGLVFANDPSVPPELRGINDEDKFRGLVSCLAEGKAGIEVVNILTKGFHATRSGNSTIDAHVNLPEDCVAPIIFVMSGSENKWFSVTGAETK